MLKIIDRFFHKGQTEEELTSTDRYEISNYVILGNSHGFTIDGKNWVLKTTGTFDGNTRRVADEILDGSYAGPDWQLKWKSIAD